MVWSTKIMTTNSTTPTTSMFLRRKSKFSEQQIRGTCLDRWARIRCLTLYTSKLSQLIEFDRFFYIVGHGWPWLFALAVLTFVFLLHMSNVQLYKISLVYDVMLECSRSIFEPLCWGWAKNNGSCVRQHLNVQRGIDVIRNTGSVECFVTQYISKIGAIHFWGEMHYISVECDKFSDTGFEWRWRPLWSSSCNKSWCHVHLVQYFSIRRYFCINVFFVPNNA